MKHVSDGRLEVMSAVNDVSCGDASGMRVDRNVRYWEPMTAVNGDVLLCDLPDHQSPSRSAARCLYVCLCVWPVRPRQCERWQRGAGHGGACPPADRVPGHPGRARPAKRPVTRPMSISHGVIAFRRRQLAIAAVLSPSAINHIRDFAIPSAQFFQFPSSPTLLLPAPRS